MVLFAVNNLHNHFKRFTTLIIATTTKCYGFTTALAVSSNISYADPDEEGSCNHDIKDLKPTNKWFPTREIHEQVKDSSWASLFDYSHILEGAPVDAYIELQCKSCKTHFYTMNAYYIGYSEIFYSNPEEQDKCGHDLKELKLTKRRRGRLN